MDAKAKVVVYRPVVRKDGNATCGYTAHMTSKPDNRDSDWRGEESRQWVRLTDHEAALDELTERHAATERNACLMAELANEEKRKRQELLSGLEALAGEIKELGSFNHQIADDYKAGQIHAFRVCAAKLRTLTNSAKDSTKC